MPNPVIGSGLVLSQSNFVDLQRDYVGAREDMASALLVGQPEIITDALSNLTERYNAIRNLISSRGGHYEMLFSEPITDESPTGLDTETTYTGTIDVQGTPVEYSIDGANAQTYFHLRSQFNNTLYSLGLALELDPVDDKLYLQCSYNGVGSDIEVNPADAMWSALTGFVGFGPYVPAKDGVIISRPTSAGWIGQFDPLEAQGDVIKSEFITYRALVQEVLGWIESQAE